MNVNDPLILAVAPSRKTMQDIALAGVVLGVRARIRTAVVQTERDVDALRGLRPDVVIGMHRIKPELRSMLMAHLHLPLAGIQ